MSRYKSTRNKQDPKIIIIRLLLGAALIVVVFFAIRAFVRGRNIAAPAVHTDALAVELYTKKALKEKVIELQTMVHSYDARIARAELLEHENTAFKKELGRSAQSPGIVAHVLTAPNRSFYDSFTVDAGSLDGVTEGAIVYAFDAIALGVVTRVTEKNSVVTLFSEPERQTTGNVASSDLAITLVGRGGGEFEVRMPRDVSFSVGDLVALQSSSPAVLAEIKKVMTDPRDPFQKLFAKTPVNLTALKWVIIR